MTRCKRHFYSSRFQSRQSHNGNNYRFDKAGWWCHRKFLYAKPLPVHKRPNWFLDCSYLIQDPKSFQLYKMR